MAMTFDAMVAAMNAATNPDRKFAILVDFLRDNSISSVISAAGVVNAIPTVDPADDGVTIWSDEGVLKVSGAAE